MGIISTVKKFIYAIAILLALSSLAVALGYIFIDASEDSKRVSD